MERNKGYASQSESDLDLGGDQGDWADQFGTPKTRRGMLRKPHKQPVKPAPGIPRAKSSRSLNRAKSKEGSQQRRQNMDKKYSRNLSKKNVRKGSEAARRQKQDARLYKELTTTFQVLGIDALLLKEDVTGSSHIPFAHTTSCRASTFVSETNSEASMVRGAGTSSDVFDGGERFLCEGAQQLLEEYSAEFNGDIPEKVRIAEEWATDALEQLRRPRDFEGCSYEHHSDWVRTIEYCRTIAQEVAEEMQFSMPVPISGSLEALPPTTDEGDRIIAILGTKIQDLHEGIHEQAIQCAERLAPCFDTQDESSLKEVFESTGKLIRNCQLLLESEAKLEDTGIGYFFLQMPPRSMENLQHALLQLLCAATTATEDFQKSLLISNNLRHSSPDSGKSAHELSEAGRVLIASWTGCYELVTALARPSGRVRTCALVASMQKLKYTALHQFASTLTMAAAWTAEMQQPFQAARQITPSPNVWKRTSTTMTSGIINDEVVQAQLWLVPCIWELLKLANTTGKQLKAHIDGRGLNDGTGEILEGMRHSFCSLTMASTSRMSWLLSRPESVARWALESLETQGSQTLYHVKKYDQGALAFDDEYLNSNEGIKRYRSLREGTDQLTNAIFNVRTKLHLRRASDEPGILRNPSILGSRPGASSTQTKPFKPAMASQRHSRSSSSFSSMGQADSTMQEIKRTGSALSAASSGRRIHPRGSLLTKAMRNEAGNCTSPLGGAGEHQASNGQHTWTGHGSRLGMRSGVQPQGPPSPHRAQGRTIRSRGIDMLGVANMRANTGRMLGPSTSTENGDGDDKRGQRTKDTDVFPMDLPKDSDIQEPIQHIVAIKSPFGGVAAQKAAMRTSDSMKRTSSKAAILTSPFAYGPPGPASNLPKEQVPQGGRKNPSVAPPTCATSLTAQLNNSATSKGLLQNSVSRMSYAQALSQPKKVSIQPAVVSDDKLPDTPGASTPNALASSLTNAEVLENILETKISSQILSPGTNTDFEGSSQLDSSRVPYESEKGLESTGLPMGQMDDMSKIQKKEIVIRSKLGAGASGQVFECAYQGAPCAVKVLNRPGDLSAQAEFVREMEMHQNLAHHPNVVRFFGECKDFIQIGAQTGSGLVMELCALGSILNLITEARYCRNLYESGKLEQEHKRNPGYLLWSNWKKRLKLAKDVACGMRYLHSHGIIHRDLTSYNVVVHLSWEAKVCDFARSKLAPKNRLIDRSDTIANSPAWSAPEIVAGEPYSTQADVFSLGVILWELATLERPWEDQLSNAKHFDWAVINQVKAGNTLMLPEEVNPKLPEWPEVQELISDCWKLDATERPTTEEVHERLEKLNAVVEARLRKAK